MLLSTHDDPHAAADFLLTEIEADLEALGALPADLSHFRERMADVAAQLREHAIRAPRRNEVTSQHSTDEGIDQ